jgi:hypothetical protein
MVNPPFMLHNITYQKTVSGIPWAFDQAQSHLVQWQAKLAAYQAKLLVRQTKIDQELRKIDLFPTSKTRLSNLLSALKQQAVYIDQVLPEFKSSPDALAILQALSDRVPSNQHIESYFNNIFRDWAWGNTENQAAIDLLTPYFSDIQSEISSQELIALGAGACRLPLDLHLKFKPAHTTCVDINPLLMATAKKLLDGEKISLYEFPVPVADVSHVAHKHELSTDLRKPDNFHFVFADGLNLPVPDKSAGTIFTPWFIDIVPVSVDDLASRINQSLKNGGIWINFGPLGFSDSGKSQSYTFQEVKELLHSCGFTVEKAGEGEIPYMHSPFSTQKRTEKVFLFRARKNKYVKKRPRFKYLPDFLSDPTKPFEFSRELQTTLENARITTDLVSLIDGKRSLDEIGEMISRNSNVPKNKAVENLLIFFVNLFETHSR